MSEYYRRIPNQLTALRLMLAVAFFALLNQYRYPTDGAEAWWLLAAGAVFVLAALTDWADGYLARRWQVETAFGRIMDPVCDKVLVVGAFAYLAGPRFVNPEAIGTHDPVLGLLPEEMTTGFYPWMVAAMLARELLVTVIRSELESTGVHFGAKTVGKAKTVLQLVGVPVLLLIVWLDPTAEGHAWLAGLRHLLVYAIVVVTIASGVPYVRSAVAALRPSG